jgi:hypothetical protein
MLRSLRNDAYIIGTVFLYNVVSTHVTSTLRYRRLLKHVVLGRQLDRIRTPPMNAITCSDAPVSLGNLPEEILTSILQNHLDVSRMTIPEIVGQMCSDNPLQLRCNMQMSLCRVSRHFYRCASHLMRRNGLLRITCWLDPHIQFYYLSPTVCRADRADMFQVPSPHLTIYLTHDFTDAVCVQSVASVHHLPLLLEIVQLHHTAGSILLPTAYDVHDVTREIRFRVSYEVGDTQPCLQTVKSSLHKHLPGLSEGNSVDGILHYALRQQKTDTVVQTSSWYIAFQLGRMLSISSHHSSRQLGLKIVRYLLVSMLVVTEPLNTVTAELQSSNMNLRIMALLSAALIDALVVEPELFSLFYDGDSADLAFTFHHEVCPCRYMPHGIDSGEAYGFATAGDSWWFIRIVIHLLHSILVREPSIKQARIESLRQLQADLPSNAIKLQLRCDVYIKALERYYLSSNCDRCLSAGLEETIYFPSMPETQG